MSGSEEVFVQVRFKVTTKYGEYSDAIYYTLDEYKNLKEADKELEKNTRADNWVNLIESPPVLPEEPVKEDSHGNANNI